MNREPTGLAIGTFCARELLQGLLRPSLAPQTRPSPALQTRPSWPPQVAHRCRRQQPPPQSMRPSPMAPLPQTRRAQLPRPSLLVQLRVPQTTAVGR